MTGWCPVIRSDALLASPVAAVLFGQPLVLWRNAAGQAVAMADRCPHRGAALSLGAVVQGHLQCPYHGWQFSSSGACAHIPADPSFVPSSKQSTCLYAAHESHGLVWVRLDVNGLQPIDLPQEFASDWPERRLVMGPFDVCTSAPRVVENFLDTAHFPFVHAGWLGKADETTVPDYEVTHTADGRPKIPGYSIYQPKGMATDATDGQWQDYRYEVLGPYAASLTKRTRGSDDTDAYALLTCPVAPNQTRVWFVHATTNWAATEADLLAFQTTIFMQDKPVLESQTPACLPLDGREAMCRADRMSAAYRRYLLQSGVKFGVLLPAV